MKSLLHIIATPRGDESRTLKVTDAFLGRFKARYPDCKIDELNVFTEKLPELTAKRVDGKYVLLSGKDLSGEFVGEWKEIVSHIERFMAADAYLLSTPMWNLIIPYEMKHYLDVIVQPKYLFRYTDKGPEGMVKGKKILVITSRGGDYSEGSPFSNYDMQKVYLPTIFGFIGLKDIAFLNAQPMDALGPKVAEEKINLARGEAVKLADKF